MNAMLRRLQRHSAAEAGFTIIEMMVAIIVIAVGLLGLMAVQVRSIGTVALAGQRQTATGLANQVMEQMRSLPYGTLTGGLACTDVASDPTNIAVTSAGTNCVARFRPSYDTTIDEVLVTTSGSQVAPLNPHVQPLTTTKVKSTQYTVRVYISRVNPDPNVDAGYWLSVVSSWASSVTGGQTKLFAARSQVYSPKGCLATTTHPFSGPCQAYHYSDAGSSTGGVTVTATRAGQAIVDGLTTVSSLAGLPGLASRVQSEQVLTSQSEVTTSSFKTVSTAAATASGGGSSAVSSADTDPSSGTANSPASASSASQTSPSTANDNGGGAQLAVDAGSSGTGSTLSTVAAVPSPECRDDAGVLINNGEACSSSSFTVGAAAATTLRLNSLGVRSMTLGSIDAGPTVWRSWGGRSRTGTADHCTGTSGAGCIGAGVRRSLGTVTAGKLADLNGGDRITNALGMDVSSAFASGATPMVSVTGYTDRASTESGINPKASVRSRTGSLTYWSGSGFAPAVNLATVGTTTLSIPEVTGRYGTTTVAVSGQVVITAPGDTVSGSTPCLAAACGVTARAGTVRVDLTYVIASGGVVTGAFTVSVDLGATLAQTNYKAAPSA